MSTFENDEQRTKIEQNQSEKNAETRERNRKKVNTAVIRNDQIQMHLKMLCSLQKKKAIILKCGFIHGGGTFQLSW